MCSNYPGIKLKPALGTWAVKIEHLLSCSRCPINCKTGHFTSKKERERLQNVKRWKMHVQSVQKILFFIVKYANLWVFCYRRRRDCLSSLIIKDDIHSSSKNDISFLYWSKWIGCGGSKNRLNIRHHSVGKTIGFPFSEPFSLRNITCGQGLWTMDWHNSLCALIVKKGA